MSNVFLKLLAALTLSMSTMIAPALAQVPPPAPGSLPRNADLTRLIQETRNHSTPLGATLLDFDPRKVVAHRGLFHEAAEGSERDFASVAENSVSAVIRARNYGIKMVEIDVRLSSDGVPIVLHDHILNRNTTFDVMGGDLNIIYRQLNGQDMPPPILVSSQTADVLTNSNIFLKAYSAGGMMSVTSDRLLTLRQFLIKVAAYNNAPGTVQGPLIILDLQSPALVSASARVVRELKMQERVVLKFFSNRAVPDDLGRTGDMSYIARRNIERWGNDLWYIIQFNNGELTDLPGNYVISKSGFDHTAITYAKGFIDTGRVIGIGMSMPNNGVDPFAVLAVQQLKTFFSTPANRVPLFGILGNPDSSARKSVDNCFLHNHGFVPDGVTPLKVFPFSFATQTQRREFANSLDYIIADALPSIRGGQPRLYTDSQMFSITLCGIN